MLPPSSAESLDWTAGEAAVRARLESICVDELQKDNAPCFRILGLQRETNLLMRLQGSARIWIEGPLGDYAFAMLDGPEVRLSGEMGLGLGEGMVSGSIRVNGNCGDAVGLAMHGGTIAVYGHAGNDCARAMDGGEVFVRGHVGRNAGACALSGALMIAGDAGPGLGDQMQDAVIYVRGSVSSLGRGVVESPISPKDRLRLGLLMINAGIRGEAKDFRRYISLYSQQQGNDQGRELRMGGLR